MSGWVDRFSWTAGGYACKCGAGSPGECSEDAESDAGRECLAAWNAAVSADFHAVVGAEQLAREWPSLSAVWDEPEPAAVLSVEGRGTLAGAGEPCILSGPGGAGKSSLMLCLALAAGEGRGVAGDAGGGLMVRRGVVAIASYEDALSRLAGRARWLNADRNAWAHVRVWRGAGPLWVAGEGGRTSGPGPAFDDWRRGLEGASLAVLDPASVAFAWNVNDAAAVRAFLGAAADAAADAGAGLVILAHDTKAARYSDGGGPGAGAVAGSGQWYDGARSVLHLSGVLREDVAGVVSAGGIGGSECRILRVVKGNYARSGGGWLVRPEWDGARWRGLRIGGALSRRRIADADAAALRRPPKKKAAE